MTLEMDAAILRGAFRVRVALSARPGETLSLLGPNGAGKSTVAACLAGLVPPAEGRIEVDGTVWDDAERGIHVAAQRRSIGMVFQEALLLPHLSALENAAFPLRARGVRAREARARAGRLLAELGLPTDRAASRPSELSGGQIQRVALARALIHRPRVLVLDEPTASLDLRARAGFGSVLRTVASSFAGIRVLITHDAVEAMSLSERIVVLEDGVVTQSGPPESLRAAPRTDYVAELVGVNLFAGRLEPLEAGAARLVTSDGALIVASSPSATGVVQGVLGILRPTDVTLHVRRPDGGSARNVLHGIVRAVSVESERARVRIASSPPLVAEVTRGSIERLGLAEGVGVWASFKAVEVDLRLPS